MSVLAISELSPWDRERISEVHRSLRDQGATRGRFTEQVSIDEPRSGLISENGRPIPLYYKKAMRKQK